MPTYITKASQPASRDEYREWQKIGFNGNFECYLAAKLPDIYPTASEISWGEYKKIIKHSPPDTGVMFWNGDLGPHCSDCLGFGDHLCDYPVGNDKTCGRLMCEYHSKEIGNDLHYCKAHHEEWCKFRDSGGVNAELSNVVAIGSEK